MSLETFEKIVTLLDSNNANYKVVEHEPVRTSEEAARIRGTALSQGAKAMLCRVKITSNQRQYVQAVFPADQQADFTKIAQAAGGKKASLATPEEAYALTDCLMGAVPPFCFNPEVMLIIDPTLATRHEEISFNAGLRERSIILSTQDYLRIVNPKQASIIKA